MLSVRESAGILGVSTARVRALIAAGALPARKIGRTWALEEEAVMDRLSSAPKPGRPSLEEHVAALQPQFSATRSDELHALYVECKETFFFRPNASEIAGARTREEAAFYMAVADFFLKSKQAELVSAGVY